ncbi:hypothetical protein QQP08_003931 [Theobroma cacao]|nr:hypothetical protein QQP08_003931 [Theobroma cacao]
MVSPLSLLRSINAVFINELGANRKQLTIFGTIIGMNASNLSFDLFCSDYKAPLNLGSQQYHASNGIYIYELDDLRLCNLLSNPLLAAFCTHGMT